MKRTIAVFLALALCLGLGALALAGADSPVNVLVLNGTTGFGMAKLMADAAGGNAMSPPP